MNINYWECCGRHLSAKATCKTCGKVKPLYGVLPDEEAVKRKESAKNKQRNINNRKLAKLPEPEEGKFFTSCMPKDYVGNPPQEV